MSFEKARAQELTDEEADEHVRLIETDSEYRERWFTNLARTVAVDFDGVIHPYTEGWQGFVPADEPPMPGVVEFLAQLCSEGYNIIVFSTRCDTQAGTNGTKEWLAKWGLDEYVQMVTCRKPAAIAYVGRWMVPFLGDWTEVSGGPKSEKEAALKVERAGPVPYLSESEWGYIGGLIDGEGCISGARNGNGNPYLRLMVTNQHRTPLEWFAEKVGGSIHEKKVTPESGYRFPVFQWNLAGARMGPLLEGCLSRKVIRMKEPQARLALEFLRDCRYDGRSSGTLTRVLQEQRLVAISQLNQWGISVLEPPLVDDRAVPYKGDFGDCWQDIQALAGGRAHGAAHS